MKNISILPYPLRKIFAQTIDLFPLNFINNFKGLFNFISGSNVTFFGDKVSKFSHKMKYVKSLDELYLSSISTYQEPSSLLVSSNDLSKKIFELKKDLTYLDFQSFKR